MSSDQGDSSGVSPSVTVLSALRVAELLAPLYEQYAEMTQQFNEFTRTHTGLECVQELLPGGQFSVAAQDSSDVQLTFVQKGRIEAIYTPHWIQNNSFGTTQGGFLAVPLDGIITLAGRTLVGAGQVAVTKGLSVSYKKPVSANGSVLKVFGHAKRDGNDIFSHGWLQDENGEKAVLARAEILVRDI